MISALEQTQAYQTLRHWQMRWCCGEYRENDHRSRAEFEQFCDENRGWGLRHNLPPRGIKPKTALLVTISQIPLAKLEGMMVKAFQMAGFDNL